VRASVVIPLLSEEGIFPQAWVAIPLLSEEGIFVQASVAIPLLSEEGIKGWWACDADLAPKSREEIPEERKSPRQRH